MSISSIIRAPSFKNDFRTVLKAEYNASLKSIQGFWCVVESSIGLYVGRLEAINPDHGDIVLNSVERVDVSYTSIKVWIRGSQVKQLVVVDKNTKERAKKTALKILASLSREEL